MKLTDPRANLIAAPTMTSHVPSSAIRRDSIDREGGGLVSVAGSYTGSDDATIDVEITSTTIVGDPQISAPEFRGVGNGTLSAIAAAPGTSAQQITVSLVDLGIRTLAAFAPYDNVTLRAKTPGEAGNNIAITVDRSGLVYTPTIYALPDAMTPGDVELVGDAWNFGAKNLNADGTIPADTARISFGVEPTVYRQYRIYKNGRYTYKFTPPLVTNHPQGTRVNAVTGTYEATVSDGVADDEVYSGIKTSYDFLNQVRAASELIDVDGAVAVDAKPGGMAIMDLNLHTGSYVAEEQRGGTDYIKNADFTLTPNDTAPSEALRVACTQANSIGQEVWAVYGDVSGTLPDALTGVPYSEGGYSFLIPIALGPEVPPEGFKSVAYELSGTATGCEENFVLGAQARTRTYTFRWQERQAGCECDVSTIFGGPNPDFLGVDPTLDPAGGGDMSGIIPAALVSRHKAITAFKKAFVDSQVSVGSGGSGTGLPILTAQVSDESGGTNYYRAVVEIASAEVKVDEMEIKAAKQVVRWLRDALNNIYAEKGELPPAAATKFDDNLAAIITGFGDFGANTGGRVWARFINFVMEGTTGGLDDPQDEWRNAPTGVLKDFIANNGRQYFQTEISGYMSKWEAYITEIYEEAEVFGPFDNATGAGGGVWQDHGGSGWFVSEDGLLPIQPGYYYHAAKMELNSAGINEPVPTYEFGIGIQIGCISELQPGNRIVITVRDVSSPGLTYQPGDVIRSVIVRADPVAFGGGQTGNDTLTFRVDGSVGDFEDYALNLNAPAAYADEGLSFSIAPGAVDFELEDSWTFAIEGGVFKWRINGGSWNEDVNIAPSVALTAGLNAIFDGGPAPSFVVGDAYTFTAIATNGPVRLLSPDSTAARWIGATTIESNAGDFDQVLIWHDADPACAFVLQGSNDDFATTPLSLVLPWRPGVIAYEWDQVQAFAKVRLQITGGDGRIYWLSLCEGLGIERTDGGDCEGTFSRRRAVRGGGSGVLSFAPASAAGVDSLEDLASAIDVDFGGRFGLVYGGSDGRVLQLAGDLQIEDLFNHAPTLRDRRRHTTSQDVAVIA